MSISYQKEVVIEPAPGWRAVDLAEVWRYRELFQILAWRDLKVRYRQTLLGVTWVLVQPLLTVALFTLLFQRVANLDTGTGLPYPLFVISGVSLWNFFASGVTNGGNSLIGSAHLISKVYFPRLLIPSATAAAGLADFAVVSLLLGGFLVYYGVLPGIEVLLLPVAVAVAFALSLGLALWLSALNVEYRDIRVVVPFVMQLWMFATPVLYPIELLPERFRVIAGLNPMSGAIEAFRGALLGTPVPAMRFGWSAVCAALLLVSGAFYFRRMERTFADRL